MKTRLQILIFLIISISPISYATTEAPGIIGPDMQIINNNIMIHFHIDNVAELETHIRSGIEKEVLFTVELMRAWRFWPDEFVVSKKISKVIRYDNLRERYRGSSYDGVTRTDKSFKDYDSVKDWIFSINKVNLANIKELDPGSYYIRTVVESKSQQQLPLIGFIMHFIPEVEMSLAKESQPFRVGGGK